MQDKIIYKNAYFNCVLSDGTQSRFTLMESLTYSGYRTRNHAVHTSDLNPLRYDGLDGFTIRLEISYI